MLGIVTAKSFHLCLLLLMLITPWAGSAGAEEIDKRRLSRKMAGDLQNYPRGHIAPVPTPAPAPAPASRTMVGLVGDEDLYE